MANLSFKMSTDKSNSVGRVMLSERGSAHQRVSVVVPVRNEEKSLARLVESLLGQSHKPDEIVLVDGGSVDNTVRIAKNYVQRGVRVLEIGPAYPGRGRNEGIKAARNDWIALIDAGCVANKEWLENLVLAMSDKDAEIVFGLFTPRIENEWDVAQALAFVGPFSGDGCRPWFTASCLLHRSVWEEVGGFPEHLRAAEDLVFFERIRSAGVMVARCAKADVRWSLARNIGGVFRRLRLYSAHHLAAGMWRTWHLRVFAMDLVALFMAIGAILWPPAAALLMIAVTARVLRSAYERRLNITDGQTFRPDRLLRVAVLLFVSDLAAWVGAGDLVLGREASR